MQFKLVSFGVIRLDDNANIPDDPRNRDWIEYQAWLLAGNTPLPADPAPNQTQLDQRLTNLIDLQCDGHLETRFNFEIDFDQENRIRVLENKQPVTKLQYKNAIINRFKQILGLP